jgi:hypothetical protein
MQFDFVFSFAISVIGRRLFQFLRWSRGSRPTARRAHDGSTVRLRAGGAFSDP